MIDSRLKIFLLDLVKTRLYTQQHGSRMLGRGSNNLNSDHLAVRKSKLRPTNRMDNGRDS